MYVYLMSVHMERAKEAYFKELAKQEAVAAAVKAKKGRLRKVHSQSEEVISVTFKN